MNNTDFCNQLKKLREMFDCGVELLITDDGVIIKGYDFYNDNSEDFEHISMERIYDMPFEYNEDSPMLVDTYTAALKLIARDNIKINKEHNNRIVQ